VAAGSRRVRSSRVLSGACRPQAAPPPEALHELTLPSPDAPVLGIGGRRRRHFARKPAALRIILLLRQPSRAGTTRPCLATAHLDIPPRGWLRVRCGPLHGRVITNRSPEFRPVPGRDCR
jgi:hypothetical protein